MKYIFLGIFTLFITFIWIFYVVVSIHSKKFSKFSTVIDRNLKLVFTFLLFLSISGYLVIIFGNLTNFSTDLFGDKPNSVRVEKYDIETNAVY